MNQSSDPRRHDRITRYKAPQNQSQGGEDLMPDYMNILGIFVAPH